MRSKRFLNNFLLSQLVFLTCLVFKPAYSTNGIEDKIKNISLQLRCMTCQNQTIHESETEFAKDIKKLIKKQIIEGKTENEIIIYLVDRYGEFILFRPLLNKKNIFLWLFPFILFAFSLIFLGVRLKK